MADSHGVALRTVGRIDRVGSCLSFACAVHCVLIPFVVTLLPLLGLGFLKHSAFEVVMVVIAVSLATLSLCWGSRIHGKKRTLFFVLGAVILFIAGHEAPFSYHWTLMGLGGLCLVGGHLLNRRLCRSCQDCSH
jgi:hypothetical protein